MYVRSGQHAEMISSTWRLQLGILAVAAGATALKVELLGGDRFELPALVVTILGTALAFFVGFINNQAYDRWWEARKIWGALVNDSRNFALMVRGHFIVPEGVPAAEVTLVQQRLLHRHIAFLKATVAQLRGVDDDEYEEHLLPEELVELAQQQHKPVGLSLLQRRSLSDAEALGYLDAFRHMLINHKLDAFIDSLGKAERIKSTVFPLGHVYLTRASLWLFIVLLPIVLADSLGYWAILFTWVLGFLYVLTFNAGQAIVDPFENKPSDTPMSTIVRTIEINLRDIMQEDHHLDPLKTREGTHRM